MRDAAIALVLILAFNGCARNPDTTVWDRAGIDDYNLTIKIGCFCAPQKYTVEVRNGTIASIVWIDGDSETWDKIGYPRTVDDLFDVIARGRDADSMTVEYNEVGVPTQINIDRSRDMSDDEMGYSVAFVGETPTTVAF